MLPQRVVDREIVILKALVDPAMARLLVQRVKRNFFARARGFLKPKSYEIRFISAQKFYEPFIIVGGRYAVDYCKRYIFKVRVNEKMQSIFILGKRFRPEPSSGVVRLEGEGHFHYENQATFILDRMGREIMPQKIAYAAYAEERLDNREEICKKLKEVKVSPQQVIEFLKSRIAKRPSGCAERVTKEWFEVNQHLMVYIPTYELAFQNINTGKTKIVKIDGIVGKIRARDSSHLAQIHA